MNLKFNNLILIIFVLLTTGQIYAEDKENKYFISLNYSLVKFNNSLNQRIGSYKDNEMLSYSGISFGRTYKEYIELGFSLNQTFNEENQHIKNQFGEPYKITRTAKGGLNKAFLSFNYIKLIQQVYPKTQIEPIIIAEIGYSPEISWKFNRILPDGVLLNASDVNRTFLFEPNTMPSSLSIDFRRRLFTSIGIGLRYPVGSVKFGFTYMMSTFQGLEVNDVRLNSDYFHYSNTPVLSLAELIAREYALKLSINNTTKSENESKEFNQLNIYVTYFFNETT